MNDPPASDANQQPRRSSIGSDRSAAVVLEYALIVALVAVIAIGAVVLFANSATNVWTNVGQEVGDALGG